ncbi:unnamed protein product [Cyclocybe aegerita]|uniref:Uncharacterized protein n=1 Tax=Cyclocybe aegerita TaxID=1973307 RepID=A0A8S0WCX3_CYCAE|nr:unnamed protein product [Cyclocybe aegerita]
MMYLVQPFRECGGREERKSFENLKLGFESYNSLLKRWGTTHPSTTSPSIASHVLNVPQLRLDAAEIDLLSNNPSIQTSLRLPPASESESASTPLTPVSGTVGESVFNFSFVVAYLYYPLATINTQGRSRRISLRKQAESTGKGANAAQRFGKIASSASAITGTKRRKAKKSPLEKRLAETGFYQHVFPDDLSQYKPGKTRKMARADSCLDPGASTGGHAFIPPPSQLSSRLAPRLLSPPRRVDADQASRRPSGSSRVATTRARTGYLPLLARPLHRARNQELKLIFPPPIWAQPQYQAWS